ncbi:hypothetical protein DNTS_022801 [Danionella cerebrum]|uniref:RING-type domain-containing protein n=1 Tax=Danionella cerebrum TaxID=2873325 RepID=A0A553MTN2_9TELE|nr:hypothetical protein DNTS_022801 [Danionella translucida]
MKAGASSMWASCCGLLNEVMGSGAVRTQPPGGFGSGAGPFRFAPGAGYSTYPPSSSSGGTGLACKACGLAFSVFRRKDPGDAGSISLLNLEPHNEILEVSPATQRRARASLSDLAQEEEIESLTVRQLKEILARNFVNFSGCCEKWELVERVHRLYRENQENRKSMENVSNSLSAAYPRLCNGGIGDGVPVAQLGAVDENLCRICMDAVIDCVLLECGHMVTCTKCGKRMNECPICRQYVVRAVHVFKS